MARSAHTSATLDALNEETTAVRSRRAFVSAISSSFSGTARIIVVDNAGTEHTIYDGTSPYDITDTISTVVDLPCVMGIKVKVTSYTSGSIAVTVQSDTSDSP